MYGRRFRPKKMYGRRSEQTADVNYMHNVEGDSKYVIRHEINK